MLNRHNERFLNRVFTPVEQQYSRKHRHSTERLAARFAVKEAVMKMLGTGWQNGVSWTDIETRNDPMGKPKVYLYGKTAQLAEKMGVQEISISITHTSELAIASVIAWSDR
jgi:holo-[acyl-carrier protein] synthase